MIILEGPDNSGKTHLSQALARLTGANVVHSTRPEGKVDIHQALQHGRDQLIERPVILDRVYAISEIVYGNILRGQNALGMNQHTLLAEVVNGGHFLIYCRPKNDTILIKNGRRHAAGVEDNHLQIINFYDILIGNWKKYATNTFVFEYDWENPDHLPELTKLVEAYWNENYENN